MALYQGLLQKFDSIATGDRIHASCGDQVKRSSAISTRCAKAPSLDLRASRACIFSVGMRQTFEFIGIGMVLDMNRGPIERWSFDRDRAKHQQQETHRFL
jgi:hypothetical protein